MHLNDVISFGVRGNNEKQKVGKTGLITYEGTHIKGGIVRVFIKNEQTQDYINFVILGLSLALIVILIYICT